MIKIPAITVVDLSCSEDVRTKTLYVIRTIKTYDMSVMTHDFYVLSRIVCLYDRYFKIMKERVCKTSSCNLRREENKRLLPFRY